MVAVSSRGTGIKQRGDNRNSGPKTQTGPNDVFRRSPAFFRAGEGRSAGSVFSGEDPRHEPSPKRPLRRPVSEPFSWATLVDKLLHRRDSDWVSRLRTSRHRSGCSGADLRVALGPLQRAFAAWLGGQKRLSGRGLEGFLTAGLEPELVTLSGAPGASSRLLPAQLARANGLFAVPWNG